MCVTLFFLGGLPMTNTFRRIYFFPVFIFALVVGACGGGGGGATTSQGQFVDAAVEGITYTSGGKTGVTDVNGNFSYATGGQVTFSVGGIVLGTVNGSAIVTPVQLIAGAKDQTDPAVTNIVQFLLTIDDDQDATNGIKITPAIRAAAAGLSIDFTLAGFDTDSNVSSVVGILTSASSIGNRVLVSNSVAQTHLSNSLFSLMAYTYNGTYTGTDSGNWSVNVTTNGTVSGSGNSNTIGPFSILGSVTSSGTTTAIATGSAATSTWAGTINITNGNFAGSWSGVGESGTFTGSKQ